MLGKLDFTLLPTTRDVIRVKNEILATEKNIRDALLDPICAHTMIPELERELEMLKAWIAPIRRLNDDILALVFEMCGEDDWKTPLQIAATCRDWRNLVLTTPRAWQFFPVRKTQNIMGVKRYLERSFPRPLHVYLPDIYVLPLLYRIIGRLECLTLEDVHYNISILSWPKLTRLVITDGSDIQISQINATRFPALRHLVYHGHVGEEISLIDADRLNPPPLQSLTLTVTGGLHWLSILEACQDSLLSLSLNAAGHLDVPRKSWLAFPRLVCLETDGWPASSIDWFLELETPVLKTYSGHTSLDESGSLMLPDVKVVTQLRADLPPEPLMFPSVNLIQFDDGEWKAGNLLHCLKSNPAHFPELETIEVATSSKVPNDMVEQVVVVNTERKQAISIVFTSKLRDLHGMVRTQLCGSNMPCYYES